MGKRTSLYLSDPTLWDKIGELAEKLRRSKNEVMEMLLRDGVQRITQRLETSQAEVIL